MLFSALNAAVLAAASGASDTGGKDPGESASAWHTGGFLFWMLIIVAAVLVLVGGLVYASRR